MTRVTLNRSLVPFKEIRSGDFFIYGETIWMKFTPDASCISDVLANNAVYIPLHNSGEPEDEIACIANFEPDEMVTPLNAEISLSPIK